MLEVCAGQRRVLAGPAMGQMAEVLLHEKEIEWAEMESRGIWAAELI